MTFIIIQHGLRDRHSHYYNETLGWMRVCRAAGVESRLYIHRDAEPPVIESTGGLPVFPIESGADFIENIDPVSGDIHGLIKIGGAFAQTLNGIGERIGPHDTVVVPFSSDKEVFGAAEWLESRPAQSRPRVAFVFHHGSRHWTRNGDVIQGDISSYRYAGWRIKTVLPAERLAFFATTPELGSMLAQVTGVSVVLCPMPMNYVDQEIAAHEGEPHVEPAHLGIVGQFRWEKGAASLPQIVAGFCRARPGRSVSVQLNSADEWDHFVQAGLGDDPSVLRSVGHLTQRAYLRRLTSLDLLLLAYDARRYVLRNSGVFAEGLAFGVPVVAPARTRMADILAEGWGGGELFEAFTVPSILEATIRASDRIGELKIKAASRSAEWKRLQSVDALFGLIAKWAGV